MDRLTFLKNLEQGRISEWPYALQKSGWPIWAISIPPPGMFRVVNLYVDKNGKLVYEYDNEKPEGGT